MRAPSRLDREERLFSWISVTERVQRDEETGDEQITKLEPIVTKSHEIRELAKFVEDEKALVKMEESRSVTIGFASSEAICETRLHNALDNIASEVNAALHFSDYLSDDDYTRIGRLKTKLERLLPSPSEIRIGSLNSNVAPRFLQVSAHYSDLYIRRYRKIANLNIGKLRRINLFVGENNSGKTSLLEAVYLLAQLNDLNAFLDLERFRGKFSGISMPYGWTKISSLLSTSPGISTGWTRRSVYRRKMRKKISTKTPIFPRYGSMRIPGLMSSPATCIYT